MLIVDPHDPDASGEHSPAEWAQLALRAAGVRWSIEEIAPGDRPVAPSDASPFSIGVAHPDDDQLVAG